MRALVTGRPGVQTAHRSHPSATGKATNSGVLMDDVTLSALTRSQVIDLTTTGRRTGEARRIEIFLHNANGQLFISGMPVPGRTRSWIYNVTADPHVIVHLKGETVANIPATARVINDPAERRPLIEAAAKTWGRTDIDVMLEHSPLIEVIVEDQPSGVPTNPAKG
jgi:deazaflavin-dependent oxidoreductase (nitroreductase family)